MFEEEEELLNIRDLIINVETWKSINFTQKGKKTTITAVDKHGNKYKSEFEDP